VKFCRWLCYWAVLCVGFAVSSVSFAKGKGWEVPVRLSVMVGYDYLASSFGDDRKVDSFGSLGAGADFNVPFLKNHMVGLNGFFAAPSGKTGKTLTGNHLLVGVYYGYAAGRFDLFLGPAANFVTVLAEANEADSNKSIEYVGTMGCGMTGFRYYPFGGKQITGGVAFNAYYCGGSEYAKDVKSAAGASTLTTEKDNTSSYGGLVSLFFGWADERKVY
jgi:hypothetical protein